MHTVPQTRRARLAVESLEDRRLLSTISGYVFSDLNNNGLYGSGDSPIAGSTLQLQNAAGQTVATAVSDMNGFYQFTTDGTISTAPQTRTVLATFNSAKTGWTQTAPVAQFDPSLGTLTSIDFINTDTMQTEFQIENLDNEPGTINSSVTGSVALSIPGANPLTAQATLSDSFNAGAFDGTINFSGASGQDTGIETRTGSQMTSSSNSSLLAEFEGTGTVTLSAHATSQSSMSGPGNVLAFLTTSEGAQVQVVYHYIPSNALKPGTYTIVQTSTPAGYLPGLKSSGGVVIPNSVNTNSIGVTLTANNSTNNDFAEVPPATVSGYVYADANNNGIKDPSEIGIPGVTVVLSGTNDLGAITPLTMQTASDGSYDFGNLRPGTYSVTETTQPAGYLTGMKTKGNISPIPGSATAPDVISGIGVSPAGDAANNNIGKIQASSLSGHVYVDLNKSGVRTTSDPPIGSVTIALTGTNDLGAIAPIVIQTDNNGTYQFNNLRPGSYTITETPPAHYNPGTENIGTIDGVTTGTKGHDQFFVSLGQAQGGIDYDFGELLPSGAPQVQPPKQPPSPWISKNLLLGGSYRLLYL